MLELKKLKAISLVGLFGVLINCALLGIAHAEGTATTSAPALTPASTPALPSHAPAAAPTAAPALPASPASPAPASEAQVSPAQVTPATPAPASTPDASAPVSSATAPISTAPSLPGSASSTKPAATALGGVPATATEAGSSAGFHELKLRLSGSMCLACLHELQRKLRKIVGVKAAIVMPPLSRIQREPAPEKYAEARIIYDTKKMTKEQLKTFIERHDFQPWNLEDFETTAVTLKDDPKIFWKEE